MSEVSPEQARATWSALEPLHALVYFAPQGPPCYASAGLESEGGAAYFASRAAAMGAVASAPVAAAFYNFNPELVAAHLPRVWSSVPPEKVLAARLKAASDALAAVLGPELLASAELAEAAELAKRAALGLGAHHAGRPLFAAHAALEWPDAAETGAHAVLWHAATLIREFRGDGHIALLVDAELDGIEALATHAATGTYKARSLRKLRAWSENDWAEAVERLSARGLLVPGRDPDAPAPTDAGRTLRARLELRTDELSVPAFTALGSADTARLETLATPLRDAVLAAGVLPGTRPKR